MRPSAQRPDRARPVRAALTSIAGALFASAPGALAQFQGLGGPTSVEHERFGRAVTAVPDVDGDGADDVAVVADDPWWGLESQRVFVYSGRTGAFLRSIIGVVTAPGTMPETFAVSGIAGLRDVNGDGRGDLAVADGPRRRVLLISGASGNLLRVLAQPAGTAERAFASGVAPMQDLDGDGRGDLIVGSPTAQLTFLDAGAAYIFSGATGALLRTLAPQPNPGPVQNNDPMFGSAVLGTPDLTGDGQPDALVAGYQRVTVISGATGGIVRVIPGFPNAEGFGRSLGACPDADGDGVADLVIGAPMSSLSATPPIRGLVAECGRAYLYSGATGTLLWSWRGPVAAGTRFGWSVAGAPDLTGDGRGDVIIGAPCNPESTRGTGYGPGRVYIYNGATGVLFRVLNSPNAELGGTFGLGVAGLGDTNATGRAEVVTGAPNEDPASNAIAEMGRAYIMRF